MNALLETDKQNMGILLAETVSVANRHFASRDEQSVGRKVDVLGRVTLPGAGQGTLRTLRYFEEELAPFLINSAGPRYFGLVTGGSTPASVVGDWLVSTFDQNACGSFDSIAPQIEHQTIDLLRQLIGIDPAFFGTFVTGATASNMVGLALGRQWAGEQLGFDISKEGLFGSPRLPILSGTPHSSVIKSMSILGIGRNTMRIVDTLPDREAVDVGKLERELAAVNGPAIVIANAGTVNTVDFDDLSAISRLKEKYPFWLHVDAAFGGFAGATAKYRHLLEGINGADSITVDAHKWLNVPYDSAMQFTRHQALQLKIFHNAAAYLSDPAQSQDFFHYTPESSRRFRALPAWFSLMAYGREGHAEIVERNCELATTLGEWLRKSSKFRLLAPVRMNVVCFTFAGNPTAETVRKFLDRICDDGRAYFTPTVYKGTPAIRAAISNWMTSAADMDTTIQALDEVSS